MATPQTDRIDVVDTLAEINLSDKDEDGDVAKLIVASGEGNVSEIELLLISRVVLQLQGGFSALCAAVSGGHHEAVELLLNRGASLQPINQASDRPALDIAVQQGHLHIAELLLDRGAVLSSQNEAGESLLMQAVEAGHADMVSLLLEEGADINYVNLNDGNTALHLASQHGRADIVHLLVRDGKHDIKTTNTKGDTARNVAANEHICALLDSASGAATRSWYGWFINATQQNLPHTLEADALILRMEQRQVARLLRQVTGIQQRLAWMELRDHLISVLDQATLDPDLSELTSTLETNLREHLETSSQLVLSERHLSTLAARHAALVSALEARRATTTEREDSTTMATATDIPATVENSEVDAMLAKLQAVAPAIDALPTLVPIASQPSTAAIVARIIGRGIAIGMVVALAPVLFAPAAPAVALSATATAMSATAAAGAAGATGAATIGMAPAVVGAVSSLLMEAWGSASGSSTKTVAADTTAKTITPAAVVVEAPASDATDLNVNESSKSSPNAALSLEKRFQAVYEEFKQQQLALEAAKAARHALSGRGSTPASSYNNSSAAEHSKYSYLFPNTFNAQYPDTEGDEHKHDKGKPLCEPCCPEDADMSKVAASKGHLHCLRRAIDLFPIHPQACTCAASGNHLHCLKLLRDHSAPWTAATTRAAVLNSAAGSLRFLLEHNCPYEDDLLLCAAEVGNVWCVKYLVEDQQMLMTEQIFGAAFERAHLQCLLVLCANDCPHMDYSYQAEDYWHVYMVYHDKYVDVDHRFLLCILHAKDKGWCVNCGDFDCPNVINYVQQYSYRFPLCNDRLLREGYILV